MAVGFNLPDPYEAQKAEIARRRKYAETLQQQALQPTEPFSYQGIQAPIPATATLAKVLQGLAGGYMQAESSREERELRESDIKKGQEFAAALQGAKTPEDRQALAFRGIGGEFGQRGQIIGSGEYQMAETRAEAERKREARRQEVEDRLQAQREAAADRLASQQAIAAGQQQTAQILAGGRLEAQREGLQLRAEGQRAAAERELDKLPVNVVTTYQTAATNERAAGETAQNMLRHVEDIKTGRLPLGPVASREARVRNYLGQSTPESLRFADMMRDVEAAVNTVLMTAKGTQTEGDARRAREQILANPYDEKVVKDALEKLAKASQESQNIYRNTLNQLGTRYRGLEHQRLAPIEIAPPAPTPPTPPGGQQPRPAPAGGGSGGWTVREVR